MKFPLKSVVRIALMAVVIAACSWLTIPATVPFTMQTFAIFAVLLIIGGKEGTAAIGLYLLLGLVGVPVFSGFRGGVQHLIGPTGGYIIGFLLSGLLYLVLEGPIKKYKWVKWPVMVVGLLLCYLLGTIWFVVVYGMRGTSYGFIEALGLCVFPYIIPDLLKIGLAALVAGRIRKLIPQLLD